MGLHSRRPVRVPMLTPLHHREHQQWAREHQNWAKDQWKRVAWCYTSYSQAPSILSFQCDHWLYPWLESRRLVVLTDAVDGSVWTACVQETAVDRATWGHLACIVSVYSSVRSVYSRPLALVITDWQE
ncbi:hypothetical protein QTP86_030000, partial [Hemibagrus guttatus]